MENPTKIEIEGIKTIHKLCKFGADRNMEGCSFTEIVERMFDELQQAQKVAVPEGFVLVPREPTKEMYLAGTEELIQIDFSDVYDTDSIQIYKAMIEAQEPTND